MKKSLILMFLAVLAFLPSPKSLQAQTGFSATAVSSDPSVGFPLSNGGNSVYFNSYSGGNLYNDGNFDPYGVYQIPTSGLYHFDVNVMIKVASGGAPNQNVDVRLMTCGWAGCENINGQCAPPTQQYPWQGAISTVAQGGSVWMGSAPSGYFYPNYAPSVSFTGYFTAGTNVGVCVDNWAASGGSIQEINGSGGLTNFSGFKIN